MSTLTMRLPESTAERLKSLARARGMSVNKLIEELRLF
ncbi:MAG: ribbon-helix-helix protein, CopG family [Rhodocyclaceae bacterium]|nr:ribbon-helix-helix protein, CopG family [Rhodocyclaceae bacterium]